MTGSGHLLCNTDCLASRSCLASRWYTLPSYAPQTNQLSPYHMYSSSSNHQTTATPQPQTSKPRNLNPKPANQNSSLRMRHTIRHLPTHAARCTSTLSTHHTVVLILYKLVSLTHPGYLCWWHSYRVDNCPLGFLEDITRGIASRAPHVQP
jgi:hypothetical protein